jgi:aconitate decarboxylase
MATNTLATWAVNLQYSDLPPNVITAAVESFYNWAGCAIGGSNHEAATIAYDALSPFFGPNTTSILGSQGKRRADAQHAALINGIASHVHDYDDTHLETIIHPAGPVCSAALAFAEHKGSNVTGKDLILAVVAGIEAECKVGLGVWSAHYDIGWHITSTTGSIGAAIAVCKLMALNVHQTEQAIGLAATQVTGLREMFGSHTKSFHPGRAAQNGLLAALLAARGYSSSSTALEAKRGWAAVVSTTNNLDRCLASLGHVWETAKNSFKPFPCGIVVHPAIDGCVQARKELELKQVSVESVASVKLLVHPLVLELTGKTAPKDGLEAKFSVYHGAAVGLLFGKGTPAQYEDGVVLDPEVVRLRGKITATASADVRADECKVEVTLQDGSTVVKHIHHAIGSLEVPMTRDMLTEKFVDQVTPIYGKQKTNQVSDLLWTIADAVDVAKIAKEL